MAIDPYSPCPCGSGKKLKFCCSDLAGDLEKVQKMVEGDQPHAALKHVEKLLSKQPQRASLLDLQASLQLSMHDFDAARTTIGDFLEAHPLSATANAQAAILLSAMEQPHKAIGPLQNALEQLDQEMPLRVLEAVGAVGQSLLMQGDLTAARSHLLLYAAVAPEGDNRALELLLRMNLQAGLPLLMRESWHLLDCPAEVQWQERFQQGADFSARGLWRQAEAIFAAIREEVGAVPEVVYNLALLRGWLGDTARYATGLHEYAQLAVSEDQAIEAEALAQLVNPDLEDPQLETVKLTYELADVEAVSEQMVSDKRVEDYTLDPQDLSDETIDRPRSTHVLLDRATPTTGVDLERGDIPHVLAFLSLYGKRTDRAAMLEVTTDRGEGLARVQALLGEVTQNALGEASEEEVVAKKSISEESLSWRWRLPDDTPPDHRRKLLAEQRREAILEDWANAPRAALQNKSPLEAVDQPDLRIALLASALIIEQAAVDPAELSLFVALREKLTLPQAETIDPSELDLEQIPLVRVPRFDFSKLSEDRLAKLLDRTGLMGAHFAALIVAKEMVSRPELNEGADRTAAYRQLIRLEPDSKQARQWSSEARAWSEKNGKSCAEWALMELELAIQQGEASEVQSALGEIRTSHLNEPGIAEATYRLLYSAGLVAPPNAQGGGTPMPLEAVPTGATSVGMGSAGMGAHGDGVWMAEDEASTLAEGEKKSAIWTP